MTASQPCSRCGQDNPIRYEAHFHPTEGEVTDSLAICERCGSQMEEDEFERLVTREFVGENGQVQIINLPQDQERQLKDEEMPEDQ